MQPLTNSNPQTLTPGANDQVEASQAHAMLNAAAEEYARLRQVHHLITPPFVAVCARKG